MTGSLAPRTASTSPVAGTETKQEPTVSPRVTLLIFALIVGLGLLTAAPVLVRSPDAKAKP